MEGSPEPTPLPLGELLQRAVDAITYALRMPREWPARPPVVPPGGGDERALK